MHYEELKLKKIIIVTQHSAEEDNSNLIHLTEKPVNYFKKPIIFIKSDKNKVQHSIIFGNSTTTIQYGVITLEKAK